MPALLQHPSLKELTAFSGGHLPPDEAATVESHIGECGPCCETLLSLSSEDTFVELLRQTQNSEELSESLEADEAIPPALADHPRYNVACWIAKGGAIPDEPAQPLRESRGVADGKGESIHPRLEDVLHSGAVAHHQREAMLECFDARDGQPF